MLPMLQKELVEKRKWITESEVTDLFSIAQCLPGIIAVNTAVFVGHKQKGALGGVMAAIGVALPSVLIVLVIAAFLTRFADNPMVQSAFVGLRVCVSVLIINAVIKLRKNAIVDVPTVIIFLVVFLLASFTSLHIAILIALAGLCGVVVSTLKKKPPADGGAK